MPDHDPVLIVDDDKGHLFMLKTVVADWGHAVETATGGAGALKLARGKKYSLILMDVRMDTEREGLETLAKLRGGEGPNRRTPVVIMTAYAAWQDAVDALKGGAGDYLGKPLDLDVLRHAMDKALERPAVGEESGPGLPGEAGDIGLVGQSEAFMEMMGFVLAAAPSEATVLITGESGTGKEKVARLIQKKSLRADRPFVTINCAALTDTLLESELFGHERGAFTDAVARRDGRLKTADGGTVFLDEIGDVSPAFQAKLLRTLQEGEIQPLGSDRIQKVDVRFIAATNKDLERLVREGGFREDLFYRLNVMHVRVPPLRERKGDLEALADHFVKAYAAKNKKNVKGLDIGAVDAIRRHSWPGNIRELQNAMERAVILSKGDYVCESDMAMRFGPASPSSGPAGSPSGADARETGGPLTIAESERLAVEKAMSLHGGNKTRAAKELGVTRKTLAAKIKKFGM
ncbi:MAG: sigma-54 dependent transcriptional regulator [Deltaproteobacteria bacterium]|jgi:two-component system response regulator HydG|nr:sigma-54 dependent transcriptional regulator [Deltaproteobacteria bacterium]